MKNKVFIAILLMSIFVAGLSFASPTEDEEGSHLIGWVWKVINFAILVFLIVKFGGKPLKNFLRQRTELIEKTLSEAKQAKEIAEKALKEVEERLKYKDKEVEEIIASSRLSGEKERETIILEGERLSKKIIEQARSNIDFELKRAKEEIKAEAAELAIELATKKIRDKLTPEEQKKLLEESLMKLESRG